MKNRNYLPKTLQRRYMSLNITYLQRFHSHNRLILPWMQSFAKAKVHPTEGTFSQFSHKTDSGMGDVPNHDWDR